MNLSTWTDFGRPTPWFSPNIFRWERRHLSKFRTYRLFTKRFVLVQPIFMPVKPIHLCCRWDRESGVGHSVCTVLIERKIERAVGTFVFWGRGMISETNLNVGPPVVIHRQGLCRTLTLIVAASDTCPTKACVCQMHRSWPGHNWAVEAFLCRYGLRSQRWLLVLALLSYTTVPLDHMCQFR